MKKTFRNCLAVLLCLSIIFSICVVPAYAAADKTFDDIDAYINDSKQTIRTTSNSRYYFLQVPSGTTDIFFDVSKLPDFRNNFEYNFRIELESLDYQNHDGICLYNDALYYNDDTNFSNPIVSTQYDSNGRVDIPLQYFLADKTKLPSLDGVTYSSSLNYASISLSAESVPTTLIVQIGAVAAGADTTQLLSAITAAEAAASDKYYTSGDRYNGNDAYTISSSAASSGFYGKMQEALTAAKALFTNNDPGKSLRSGESQDDVDTAAADLKTAIGNLIPTSNVNATALYEAINNRPFYYDGSNKVYPDASYYSASSWQAYQTQLTAARTMLAALYSDGKPTNLNIATPGSNDPAGVIYQAAVNAQTAALMDAYHALDPLGGSSAIASAELAYKGIDLLANTIFNPAAMTPSKYTDDSYAAFLTARDTAIAFYDGHSDPASVTDIGKSKAGTYVSAYNALYQACYYGLTAKSAAAVSLSIVDNYAALKGVTASLPVMDCAGIYHLTLRSGSATLGGAIRQALGGYTSEYVQSASGSQYDHFDFGSRLNCGVGVYINGVYLFEIVAGVNSSTQAPETSGYSGIQLHDGDSIVISFERLPVYTNLSGSTVPYSVAQAGDYVKYVSLNQNGRAATEVTAGAGSSFTLSATAHAALSTAYTGRESALTGAPVYVSAICASEADAGSAAAINNTGVVTGLDGSVSLTLYNEGWYALSIFSAGDYGGLSCGPTVIVHITTPSAADRTAVKSALQSALDNAYNAYPSGYYSSSDWMAIRTAYQTGKSSISAAAAVGDAYGAEQTALNDITAIQTATAAGNTAAISAFRGVLGRLPDDATKLGSGEQYLVDALKVDYAALTDYLKGQLTVREQQKYETVAATDAAGLPALGPYRLTVNVQGDTDAATAALSNLMTYLQTTGTYSGISTVNKINQFCSTPRMADGSTTGASSRNVSTAYPDSKIYLPVDVGFYAYCPVQNAAGGALSPSGAAWSITDGNFALDLSSYVHTTTSGNTTTYYSYYKVLKNFTVNIGNVPYEIKSITYSGIDGSAVTTGYQILSDSTSWHGKDAGNVNVRFDNADQSFIMPYSDVTVTIKWGPVSNQAAAAAALQSAKDSATASLTATYGTYSSANYSADNWAALTAAYRSGMTSIADATAVDGVAAARKTALAAMATVKAKGSTSAGADYGHTVGQVHITVENSTFTSPYGGDTPAWTGTLLSGTYNLHEKDTIMTCVLTALADKGCTWTGTGSDDQYGITYLASITTPSGCANGAGKLGEFDGYQGSGWMVSLDDWFINASMQDFSYSNGKLENGDDIRIMFSTNYGADLGETWSSADTMLKSLGISAGTLMPVFRSTDLSYGLLISGSSQSLTVTPTANNKNYLVKTFLNTYNSDAAYYKRTETLTVKPGDTIYVGCGDYSWPSMNKQTADAISYTGTKYTIKVYNNVADYTQDLIASLPPATQITMSTYTGCQSAIANARSVYDGLTAAQRSAVTNLSTLRAAEAKIRFYRQIDNVKTLLAAIPGASTIVESNMASIASQVKTAKAAYDALSPDQQLYVTVAIVANYNAAIRTLTDLGAFTASTAPSTITGSDKAPEESGSTITLNPTATASGGKASVTLAASDLSDAIGSAKGNRGMTIVIAPKITGTVGTVTVDLPQSSLSSIASDTDADLDVQTPVGNVTLPNAVLSSIVSQASGTTVTISLNTVDTTALTASQQKLVGRNTVYDISVLSGGHKITSFGNKNITISLHYTLKSSEDPSGVTVWYLDGSDKLREMTAVYDKTAGFATFTTPHLSYYVVGYTAPWTNPFADVKPIDWFYGSVRYAVQNGLFNGTSNSTFAPNDSMTRAMLVTVLYRLEGKPAVTGTNGFPDVRSGQWFTGAVTWASANKIVSGYDGGLFGTNDNITREQMAAILYRYAQYKGYDVTAAADLKDFTDASSVSTWAKDPMKWTNAEGLITGTTSTTLSPTGSATRAQVATILMRFCENIVK